MLLLPAVFFIQIHVSTSMLILLTAFSNTSMIFSLKTLLDKTCADLGRLLSQYYYRHGITCKVITTCVISLLTHLLLSTPIYVLVIIFYIYST